MKQNSYLKTQRLTAKCARHDDQGVSSGGSGGGTVESPACSSRDQCCVEDMVVDKLSAMSKENVFVDDDEPTPGTGAAAESNDAALRPNGWAKLVGAGEVVPSDKKRWRGFWLFVVSKMLRRGISPRT